MTDDHLFVPRHQLDELCNPSSRRHRGTLHSTTGWLDDDPSQQFDDQSIECADVDASAHPVRWPA